MSKTVKINYALIDAWEVWTARVPDDAPDEMGDLISWIETHQDDIELLGLDDSGNYGMEVVDVEVLET